MSLEFIDGFDHYNNTTNLGRKWDTDSHANFTGGRFGGNAVADIGASNSKIALTQGQLSAVVTRVMGFAYRASSLSYTGPVWTFMDASSEQCSLRLSTNTLTFNRGSTVLGTSPTVLVTGTWYYIEVKATIGSAGAFEVRVDGVTKISGTGNTQSTGNTSTNGIQLSVGDFSGFSYTIDDVYILNSSGSTNNTFLGDCRVLTTLPNADNTSSPSTNLTWTPNSGTTHYTQVDDTPSPDDDTTYVSSATPGQIDTYKFPAISPTGPIAGIQAVLTARKDDAAARTISAEYRSSGGTNFDGSSVFSLTTSYLMDRQIWETDPATSTAWTAAGVNGGEFGEKCIS